MNQRINNADLEHLVKRINEATGSPLEPYKLVDKKYVPQPGCYHLSWAYGGVCLEKMHTSGSGVTSVISGYGTKRELHEKMCSYLMGIEIAINQK